MASAVVKFPDGRQENWDVLTYFQKTGTDDNIVVFKTDKVDNGHKVVGVSRLKDGLYGNIIDMEEWKRAKENLVAGLHGELTDDDYKVVNQELLVTEDPYRPLALRDENLASLQVYYEQFLARQKEKEATNAPQSAPIVEQPVQINETPELPEANIPNEPVIDSNNVQIPQNDSMPSVVDANQPINNMPQNSVEVPNNNLNNSAEVVVPQMVTPEVQTAPVADTVSNIPETDVLDPFAIADSLDTQVHQDIVPPQGVDIVNNSIDTVSAPTQNAEPIVNNIPNGPVITPEPVINPAVNIDNVANMQMPDNNLIGNMPGAAITNDAIPNPVIPNPMEQVVAPEPMVAPQSEVIASAQPVNNSDSPVTTSYLSGADGIINQMREKTENYKNEMNNLFANYIKEMEELRADIARNLEEAKGINELSKQTFDKAQAINNSVNNVQTYGMPNMMANNDPSLNLTKAA